MKIGIVGNYGHQNLGDEALLLGAVESASAGAGVATRDIVVFSDNAADTRERFAGFDGEVRQLRRPYRGRKLLLPLICVDIYRSLKGIDWLVFGGGGLLNDSNRTAIPMFAIVRAVAWLRGTRVAWWSVGIGPLKPGWRARLAGWLMSSSEFVSVRDVASGDFVEKLTGSRKPLTPDLAHALEPMQRVEPREKTLVAVSVVPYRKHGAWFESNEADYAAYCEKMAKVIRGLLAAQPEVEVRLFRISLEQDAAAIADIVTKGGFHDEERVVVSTADTLDEVRREFGMADLVIATRLHSVVLAALSGVAAVTIAYQPKVMSYATELELGLPCVDIDAFDPGEVVDAASDALKRSLEYADLLQQENARRRKTLMASMTEWRAIV